MKKVRIFFLAIMLLFYPYIIHPSEFRELSLVWKAGIEINMPDVPADKVPNINLKNKGW